MLTRREALRLVSAAGATGTLLFGCAQGGQGDARSGGPGNPTHTKTLRTLATSDTHGMFLPWDYALDAIDLAGGMAKLSTAI